jgi:hypothetical protein
VDEDPDAALPAQPLGEADVVGVPVRQDEATDVVEGAAHRGQLGRQVLPVAGQAGIDDRDLAALFDQVAVDDARAEPAERFRELHLRLSGSWCSIRVIAMIRSHHRDCQ